MATTHDSFATTSAAGLDLESVPMRLYQKAKRLGVWDPRAIDFSRDVEDWQRLDEQERDVMLQLCSLFQAGEESVTLDLLPLIMVVADEGRLEEELFLTTFLWEEGKHVEFFRRVLDEVAGAAGDDLHRYHTPSYKKIFYEELPAAMSALRDDSSPAAQVRASVTYNMIVEGVLAETGYHAFYEALERNDLLPGLREGIGKLKRDESRHIAYGVFLLSRLIGANPELWQEAQRRMEELLEPAMGVIDETFRLYDPFPFGLRVEDFIEYAMSQFAKRMDRVERGAQALTAADAAAMADELVEGVA